MSESNKYIQEEQSLDDFERLTQGFLRDKFDQEKKLVWAEKLAGNPYQIQRRKKGSIISYRFVIQGAVIAATVIFTLFMLPKLFDHQTKDYQEFVVQYLEQDPFSYAELRKSSEDITTTRSKAIDAYMTKNYISAINYWQQVDQFGQATPEDHFYLGLSYLYSKQYLLAVNSFKKEFGGKDKFQQEKVWFLALSQIQAGNSKAAKTTLEVIQPDEWQYENARKILELMD